VSDRLALREYFDNYFKIHREKYYQTLLKHMSPGLRGKVAMHMHSEWVARIPFFASPHRQEREDFVTAIATVLRPGLFAPLEVVLRAGYINTQMYIIQRGLAILKGRILTGGNYFGDTMVLSNGRCLATVRSVTYLFVMILDKKSLNQTLETGNFEGTRKLIRKTVIRLALRREFLKCAAIVKVRTGKGRGVGAEGCQGKGLGRLLPGCDLCDPL
jgi:hypothetical protein